MLNYLWGFMLLTGVMYGAIQGKMAEITQAALTSAQDAISLCITMAGVVSLWVGLMEVAEQTGIIRTVTGWIQPLIQFLFPRIPREHPARRYITLNIIANIFGLGWAATPAGLKAMEELGRLEEERGRKNPAKPFQASNEMCNFLILNISSLQLIPVNMIAYRSQYGSVNPTVIVGPAMVATAVSTAAGILFCKLMDRRGGR